MPECHTPDACKPLRSTDMVDCTRKIFVISLGRCVSGIAVIAALGLAAGCYTTTGAGASSPTRTSTTAATVPDLSALPAASVVTALQAAGLVLGPTTYASSDQPAETVIQQDPEPGAQVSPGSVVAVVRSSGPQVQSSPDAAPPAAPSVAPAAGTALAVLDTLRVAGRAAKTGYTRAQFGQAWYDVDRNGCDTRNDILTRDLTSRIYKAGGSCAVASGTLADPYTGTSIRFVRGGASEVDVDHVVALGNAWVSGAQKLTYSKRVALANDPLNLLAVDSSANRQKSDGDAATWLPSHKSFRCSYVARQIGVKAKYGLYATAAEKEAMARVLANCSSQKAATGGGSTESGLSAPPATTSRAPASSSAKSSGRTDPDFGTCAAAKEAGRGPYVRGQDPEYNFYRDGDSDGVVCE